MTPKKPKKTDPLTTEEMIEAADMFMERYNIVQHRMSGLAKPEDILKVMENVAKLGHKLRADKAEEERLERFGFVKNAELDALDKALDKEEETPSTLPANFYWPPVSEEWKQYS